jgi:uncharacterized RDD family membrane protein YckC
MNCPVCQRSLAPTLSICPSCGAMMHDTVREEVQKNITTSGQVRERPQQAQPHVRVASTRPNAALVSASAPRVHTNGLTAPKTSPTLVDFNHKNKAIPEWRIQLQNAVQQRREGTALSSENRPLTSAETVRQKKTAEPLASDAVGSTADPRVANAIRRITESRNTFLEPSLPQKKKANTIRTEQPRPFGVVPSTAGAAAIRDRPTITALGTPKLVNVSAPTAFKRDTNKLPRIEIGVAIPQPAEDTQLEAILIGPQLDEIAESKRIHITAESNNVDQPESPSVEEEDIEDLAPVSMRFGAGLFDFIIGSFASMLILSPLVFAGMEWLSWGGFLTLVGTMSVILFLYMTACLGFFGKTAGMKLFSLELVDAVENEYPTIRQSAVSSSVFLISIFLVGTGFLTMLFNEEKRALHDLLSGTILVREF